MSLRDFWAESKRELAGILRALAKLFDQGAEIIGAIQTQNKLRELEVEILQTSDAARLAQGESIINALADVHAKIEAIRDEQISQRRLTRKSFSRSVVRESDLALQSFNDGMCVHWKVCGRRVIGVGAADSELDHANQNRSDNSIHNLARLCTMCHGEKTSYEIRGEPLPDSLRSALHDWQEFVIRWLQKQQSML